MKHKSGGWTLGAVECRGVAVQPYVTNQDFSEFWKGNKPKGNQLPSAIIISTSCLSAKQQ